MPEDSDIETFDRHIRAAKHRFAELIADITGWSMVDDLATLMVETLVRNVGGSGMFPYETRCACGSHPIDEHGKLRPPPPAQKDTAS